MDNNFKNKEENAKDARIHSVYMEEMYKDSIQYSGCNSRVYRLSDQECRLLPLYQSMSYKPQTKFWVNRLTTADMVDRLTTNVVDYIKDNNPISDKNQFNSNAKIAVLNFASYKNPGGMFLQGSSAQEESLCHRSTLYNVLSEYFPLEYRYNNANLNKGLYEHFAIYSPSILFDEKYLVNVLTCPAPNKTPCIRYKAFTLKENSDYLYDRIKFMKFICEREEVNALIAGAWGCGVFKQDPMEVAEYFVKIFAHSNLSLVIFSIPDTTKANTFYREIQRQKGEFVSWQTPIMR